MSASMVMDWDPKCQARLVCYTLYSLCLPSSRLVFSSLLLWNNTANERQLEACRYQLHSPFTNSWRGNWSHIRIYLQCRPTRWLPIKLIPRPRFDIKRCNNRGDVTYANLCTTGPGSKWNPPPNRFHRRPHWLCSASIRQSPNPREFLLAKRPKTFETLHTGLIPGGWFLYSCSTY